MITQQINNIELYDNRIYAVTLLNRKYIHLFDDEITAEEYKTNVDDDTLITCIYRKDVLSFIRSKQGNYLFNFKQVTI